MGSKKSSSSSSTTSNNYNQQAQLSNSGSGAVINLAGATISQSDTGAGIGTGGGAAVHVEQLSDDLVQTAFDWAGEVMAGTQEMIVDTQNRMTAAVSDSVNSSNAVAETVANNLTRNDSAEILKIAVIAAAALGVLFFLKK
ncbi:MAG: hypothetical protein IKM45_04195 [Opitutales bacterium]|nr:hypothetical protein [Opitutales bacterium]